MGYSVLANAKCGVCILSVLCGVLFNKKRQFVDCYTRVLCPLVKPVEPMQLFYTCTGSTGEDLKSFSKWWRL